MQHRPDIPDDQVIARLSAAPAKRVIGTAILLAIGALLLWVAAVQATAAAPWLVVLFALGGAAIWLGVRLWQATALPLELTPAGLRVADGRVVARMAEIGRVGHGVFAFKPSNGFVLTLDRPAAAAWAPGLWWRLGKRVGVGGVTSRHEGRAMAEIIEIELRRRREVPAPPAPPPAPPGAPPPDGPPPNGPPPNGPAAG